ncbi:MAG: hypothetical protein M1837_000853 [Sclerophora amabilis]|nr:MAG: hypothetical protein M1837_000853 [Sclerophora amabilis]
MVLPQVVWSLCLEIVGARTTTSFIGGLRYHAVRYNTIQTFAQYLFSAWWFSEVYVWSASTDANLAWIAEAKSYERPRLNERPIYLRSTFFMLAVMQSCIHLMRDYDCVELPVPKGASSSSQALRAQSAALPLDVLRNTLPRRGQASLLRCLSLIILGPIIYSLFLRRTTWSWTLFFAKIFWNLPRSSSTPPSLPPYHISLIYRSVTSGFLLVLLWEITNLTFNAYLAQEPLKRERPLTDDSRDPNGSLLTGLNAQRDVPKSFAFWELVYISHRFPSRRRTIFEEIERRDGSTWSQIFTACTVVIKDINLRVVESHKALIQPAPAATATSAVSSEQPAPHLPRLAFPLNDYPIATPSKPPSTLSTLVKSRGSGSQAPSPATPSPLRKLLTFAPSPSSSTSTMTTTLTTRASSTIHTHLPVIPPIITSSLTFPFRTVTRRVAAATLLGGSGTSTSNLSVLVDATDAITTLAVASVNEDPFGNVQKDVVPLIRLVMGTVETVEAWKSDLILLRRQQRHQRATSALNTNPNDEDDENCKEVDTVTRALRTGLKTLMDAFEPYADVLGLGLGEIRRASEITAVIVDERHDESHDGGGGGAKDPVSASANGNGNGNGNREGRGRREMEMI